MRWARSRTAAGFAESGAIKGAFVGDGGADGAEFVKLAVGVLIDALAEPVVDAGERGGCGWGVGRSGADGGRRHVRSGVEVGDGEVFAAFEGGVVGDDAGSGEGEGFVDIHGGAPSVEQGVDEFVCDEGVGAFVAALVAEGFW